MNLSIEKKVIQNIRNLENRPTQRFSFLILFVTAIILAVLLWFSPIHCFFSIKGIVLGFLIGGVLFFINYIISYSLHKIRKRELSNKAISNPIAEIFHSPFSYILFILLVASIEELIFRSFILTFTAKYFSTVTTIIINALIFTVAHFNLRFIELFLMGTVYSLLIVYTNNLIVVFTAHSINNILFWFFKKNRKSIKICSQS